MPSSPTVKILEIASRNHGICRRSELLDAGISSRTIDRRVADGTLSVVCRAVLEVPVVADELTPLVRALSAVHGSVLSRHTAGAVHAFPLPATADVHVTTTYGSGRLLAGTVVHETRHLPPTDVVHSRRGFPLTSSARTIFDLAADLGDRRLRHLVHTQTAAGSPTLPELQACFLRLAKRGRPGVRKLRTVLDELSPHQTPHPTSELEVLVWRGLRQHEITGFRPQVRPPWFDGRRGVVDFAHQRAAVILEADGRRWHARYDSMVDDRRRDRTAAANGWLVVRVMWDDLVARPDDTFAELAAIVGSRRNDGAA